jgi:hypothetical protein
VGGVLVDTARVKVREHFPLIIVDTVSRDPLKVTETRGDTLREAAAPQLRGAVRSPERWSRQDLTARFSPLSWLSLQGSVSRESRETFVAFVDDTVTDATWPILSRSLGRTSLTTMQAEAAARFGRAWYSVGLVRRGATALAVPLVYGIADSVPADVAASGVLLGAQGKVWKDVYVDVNGVSWNAPGPYRPQYQSRVELGVATNWLGRFPSGNLGIHFAIIDEYRSRTRFRLGPEATGGSLTELCAAEGALCAPPSNMLSALLEIRIQKGTLWYQLRNALNREYQLVPGLTMPRPINVYGVRWEFWN